MTFIGALLLITFIGLSTSMLGLVVLGVILLFRGSSRSPVCYHKMLRMAITVAIFAIIFIILVGIKEFVIK